MDRVLHGVDIRAGDLLLLPEMFDSGFSMNTGATADDRGETAAYLRSLAMDLHVTVMGGRTVRRCSAAACKARNHMTVFGPGGELLADYAKIHPFSYGNEHQHFEGGEEVVTFRWAVGARSAVVCPAVCYDLRFPELFRIGAGRGAEVFAIGANWPEGRRGHWTALLRARAIENQAVVLGVNRCGQDPNLRYAGGSAAFDAKGELLGELAAEAGVLTVDVDVEAVRAWRAGFPALRDVRLLDGFIGRGAGGEG